MIGVYKITNPKKQIYVGQSINIEYRLSCYKRLSCRSQPKLYNSLKKYGYDNHSFEILTECDVNQLNELERYYQDLFNVIKQGLNCVLTDARELKKVTSQEVREKIRQSLKGRKRPDYIGVLVASKLRGRKHSDERINNMRLNSPKCNLGKNLSEETKRKIGLNNKMKRKVFNKSNGRIYESILEASKDIQTDYSLLRQMLRGTRINKTDIIYL